ncbi:hypothetical protein JA1_000811 [Spathaspora sp. JA1]|nr:hypothetical protein JA1_000811 [Spathaspora sp. JA1]
MSFVPQISSITATGNNPNQMQQIDPDEDWTDSKQNKLEDYIKRYIETSTDYPRSFYKRINWPELINVVGINDQEFLQLKVDEIYDELVDQWDNEGELNINEIISIWGNKSNSLYDEVMSTINSVGLTPFKADLFEVEVQGNVKNNIVEPTIERMPSAIEIKNVQRELTGVGNVSEIPRTSTLPNLQSVVQKPQIEIPKLTKTQRRLSLDLMHGKSAYIKPTGTTGNGTLDESMLTTAAGAETTTVNVITKPEVVSRTPIRETKSTTEKATKNKRFSLLGTKKKSKSKTSIKQNNDDKGYTLSSDRRRVSLVGKSLPLYIINQLSISQQHTTSHKPSKRQILTLKESSSSKMAPLTPPSVQLETTDNNSITSSGPESVAIKSNRLQNLLANSQSLYAHSKDNDEMAMVTNSHTRTTNTSENTSQRLHYESDDEDKEYISPDSLTRYYGIQLEGEEEEDEEEILNGIGEEDEENGFVNVYGNFYNDARDENNSIGDIDDDYLFKI